MKASKIIAGLLVLLGFAGCEPGEETGCQPEGESVALYGVIPCAYESKPAVPADETVEFVLPEIEESNEPTTRREQ